MPLLSHSHISVFPWILSSLPYLHLGEPLAALAPREPKGLICLLDIYGELGIKVSVSVPSVGSINHEGELLPVY